MQPETPPADARQQFVGRLAAGVAHDVANRLAVARLVAESLAARTDVPPAALEKLDTLIEAVDEAGRLMEQLSAVSGRRKAPAHVVRLEGVLADMAPLLRAALGGRTIDVVGTGTAFVDRAEVEAAILRLVLGQRRGRNEETLEVAIVSATDTVGIAVGDEMASFQAARQGGVVLVVEDDPDLRQLVRDALIAEEFEVFAVGDADEGARVLAQERVQLLVTDVQLPGSSGLDLAARVMDDGVPVLVMSGYGSTDVPEGIVVLDKPFGVPQLRAGVRHALGTDA